MLRFGYVRHDVYMYVEVLLDIYMYIYIGLSWKNICYSQYACRYVCGMREVLKHLKSKRIKSLIVAPNMDRIESEGKAMERK